MRRKVVAVEPHSASKPVVCSNCRKESASFPICSNCRQLLDFPLNWTHFNVLQLPTQLEFEPNQLRERFYAITKQVHPDQFSNMPSEMPKAVRWTTAANRAYQTLRERDRLLSYLLPLFGFLIEKMSTKVPVDLAETYFELQDAFESGNRDALTEFQNGLRTLESDHEKNWQALVQNWNASAEKKPLIAEVADWFVHSRYLNSMKLDLEKRL